MCHLYAQICFKIHASHLLKLVCKVSICNRTCNSAEVALSWQGAGYHACAVWHMTVDWVVKAAGICCLYAGALQVEQIRKD